MRHTLRIAGRDVEVEVADVELPEPEFTENVRSGWGPSADAQLAAADDRVLAYQVSQMTQDEYRAFRSANKIGAMNTFEALSGGKR